VTSPLPRRETKRLANHRKILEAALRVFSEYGYSGTTMDAISGEARLTKPTVYKYFDSKDKLFADMMIVRRDQMLLVFEKGTESEMVEQLFNFSWRYADTVMQPEFLSLARLIIGEAQRFPEVGKAYQSAGPDRVLEGLMSHLEDYNSAGQLEFDDAELAAQDLWGLILSAPRTQALHRPTMVIDHTLLSRYIHNGLKVFLKAYSTHVDTDLIKLETLIEQSPQSASNQV
jgi:TetR/AcrR family transcriptional repressor of mexJK operon